MLRSPFTSIEFTLEFTLSLVLASVLIIPMFVIARKDRKERKIGGDSWRALLTTAVTIPGVLLTVSAGVVAYIAQHGYLSDAGLLLAGMALYFVVQIMAIWALAGPLRYTDAATDTIVFPTDKAWPYLGAFGSIYILLVLATALTASFFVFRSSVLTRVVPAAGAPSTTMVPLLRPPIRVGDSRATVVALWGRPDSTRLNPRTLYYSRDGTVLVVNLDSTRVVQAIIAEVPK